LLQRIRPNKAHQNLSLLVRTTLLQGIAAQLIEAAERWARSAGEVLGSGTAGPAWFFTARCFQQASCAACG
jgi:GNAT superfamily N-acetyltransferase